MGQHQIGVVIGKMGAHVIFLQVKAVRHGERHGALLILNVHVCNGGEAVVLRHLPVHGRGGPRAAVGGIAFHNGPVHLMDEIPDERRVEVVTRRRFSRGELHAHLSRGGPAHGLIDRHEALRGNIPGHVDHGCAFLLYGVAGCGRSRLFRQGLLPGGNAAPCGTERQQSRRCGEPFRRCFHELPPCLRPALPVRHTRSVSPRRFTTWTITASLCPSVRIG